MVLQATYARFLDVVYQINYISHIYFFIVHLLRVAEDPWMRSEIGLSGHYLQRPPPTILFSEEAKRKKRCRQRLRKSTSADFIAVKGSIKHMRPSKSAAYSNKANSVVF